MEKETNTRVDYYLKPIDVYGTVIWTTKIDINPEFVPQVIELSKTADSVRKSNRGGWQSDLCSPRTFPWAKYVVDQVIAASNITTDITYWFNVNSKDNYNEWHDHDQGDKDQLCGCLYLQVPDNSGNIEFRSKRPRTKPNADCLSIKPEVGLLVLFPDDMFHRVEPNQSDEDRISMAFNFWKMVK